MAEPTGAALREIGRIRNRPSLAEPLAWLIAASTTFFLAIGSANTGTETPILVLGILNVLLGLRVFIGHGGAALTAFGIFALSSSIVVGVGGIQEVISPQHRTAGIYLESAIYFSFVAQCLVSYIGWRSRTPPLKLVPLLDPRRANTLKWVSCGALAILSGIVLWQQSRSQALEASAFAAIVLASVGAFARANDRLRLPDLLIVSGSVVIYAQLFQGGTGRLRLVALACTIALIWASTHPLRFFKWCLVALTPLAIVALAFQRLGLQESIRVGASAGRTGLESMTEPILVFAQVIQAQTERGWPLAGGRTLLTLPISLLPRSWGFGTFSEPLGYELVRITQPARYGTGYSVAATTFGEWWYNFSFASLVLMVPFLVILLRALDTAFSVAKGRLGLRRGNVLRFAIVAMACGSIGDLAWMGLHIYGARMLWRIPATVAIVGCASALAGLRRSTTAPCQDLPPLAVPTRATPSAQPTM